MKLLIILINLFKQNMMNRFLKSNNMRLKNNLRQNLKTVSFFFLILFWVSSFSSFAQTTILSETFNGVTKPALPTGWTASPATVASSTWVTNNSNVSDYAGASAGNYVVAYNQNTSPFGNIFYLTYNNSLSTIGYTNVKVIYGGRRSGTAAAESILEWSADGTTWTATTISTPQTTTGAWALVNGGAGISLPVGASGIANLQLRWKFTQSATTSTANYSIDDVTVQGTQVGVINNTSAFNGNFGYVRVGANSATSSFTVEGNSLTQNIVVTPPSGFEMRTGTNAFSANPITLTQASGSVPVTTIDVRFTPTAYQAYSGNITVLSGAYSRAIPVSGIAAIKSIATGNWSSASTWDGGEIPTSAKNVYINSTFPVTVDAATPECKTIYFDAAGTTGLLVMGSAASKLNVYGDFNLGNTSQLVFNTWPAGAKLRFVGSASTQIINGLNTSTTNSGGFMELEVDKSAGKLTTTGNNAKLTIGTNLNIVAGTFELGSTDDIFGRDQAGNNSLPTITVQPNGIFTMAGSSSQINAGSGSSGGKIGKVTISGLMELASSSTVGIQFSDFDVESGGTLRLLSTSTWYTAGLNSGLITVKSGGTLRYSTTSSVLWNSTASVIMNSGSILNITTVTAPTLAPSFTDNGATWRYNFAGNQDGIGISTGRVIQNLELSGGGTKTLAGATTVNGYLLLSETSSLLLGTGSLTYGTGALLQYGNSTQVDPQNTTSAEWPSTGSTPTNVKVQNSGGLTLDASRTLVGNLDVNTGVITLGNNSLTAATLTGGSASAYVATTGTGSLTIKSIGTNAQLFPVGNGSYTPASITNTGTADDFSVNVELGTPCDVSALNSVNRIWNISEATAGGSNVDVVFQWNAADENSGFVRTSVNAVRCNGTNVNLVGSTGTASGTGPYSKSLTAITALNSFGITNSTSDVSLTSLVSPTSGGCKTSSETVSVSLKNNSSFPVDFTKNNIVISVTATGGYLSSITLSTGSLAAGASQNVTLPATIDMSAGGSFIFNASATIAGDINNANDALAAVTVTVSAQPVATIAYSASPYCASLNGSQNVTLTGTTGGTYSSTSGLQINTTSGSITPSTSTAGTYTVTYNIAAANGCNALTTTTSVTINPLRNASFTYGSSTTFCQSGANPSVTITGTTGGSFTSTPAGLSINSSTGAINLSASALNSYAVTYTTPGPCAESSTVNIAITSAPSASFSYANASYCSNGTNPSPVFGAGASAGNFTASPSGLSINSSTGLISLSASTAGTYTVSNNIVASGGCAAANASTTITITALPQATISYSGAPYCIGNTNNQSVSINGNTGGTFSSAPAGLSLNASTGSVLPSTSTPNTYTVTYTLPAGGGCSSVSATTSLIINPLPAATITYSGSPFCSSLNSSQLVTLTGTLGGTFTAASGLSINASTGAINPSLSTPGTYTVTYSLAAGGGCAALNATTSVTVTASPSATISYSGTPFCSSLTSGQSATFSGTIGGTYTSSTGLTLNASTGSITPSTSTAGTYTVTYTVAAAGGCSAFSTSTPITITSLPLASISYTGTPFCSSLITPQTVSFTGVTGGSYSVAPSGLNLNAANGSIVPSTSTPGTYTVSYTIPAIAGCPARPVTSSVTITQAPTATISYASAPYCQNNGLASVTRTGFSGGVYSSTTGLVINSSTGEVNLNSSTPGTYNVTYFIASSGGCASFSTSTSLTINAISFAPSSVTATPATSCGPANVTLRVVGGSLAPGANWVWYSGSCGGTSIGTGSTLTLTGVSATTNYFVRAEGGTCGSTSCASTTVTINTIPTIQIDVLGDTTLVPGNSSTLIATASPVDPGNSFAWFLNGSQVSGATNSSYLVNVDNTGSYYARVTTPFGCTALSSTRKIVTISSLNLFVSPNPSSGQFKVRYYSRATVFNFKRTLLIYNSKGELVRSMSVPITASYSSIDVDMSSMPKGLYFLQLRKDNQEKLAEGKVILQ